MAIAGKAERNAATDAAAADAIAQLCGEGAEFAGREREVKEAVRSLTKKLVRKRIVDEGKRIDGRGPRDLRPLSSEVGVLPTAHGTGLFQRGETQVMNVVTMAMPRMNQLLDTLSPETNKYFLFHYNMAPWANGETGRVGSPKRREIGHGALAARALLPVLPSLEKFNYTLRLVAEVLSSNGSTSMASVCSGSLALMDAGVPVRSAVAGIAMGLVYAEGKYTTLTDILGAEDAFGDMDFKVAGTADAVTALQLDTKIDGIPSDVLASALEQAKESVGRAHVEAGAVVTHLEHALPALLHGAQLDAGPVRLAGVLPGIGQEVLQHQAQQGRVSRDLQTGLDPHLHHPVGLTASQVFHDVSRQLTEVDGLPCKRPGGQLGQCQHGVDHRVHPRCGGQDAIQVVVTNAVELLAVVLLQDPGKTVDHAHGGSQVVRDRVTE